jgi:hypothetical protein
MIKHIVLFRVFEGTPPHRMKEAIGRLEALVDVSPGLQSLQGGLDIGGVSDYNYDFGFVAELDDRAALEAFAADPAHMEIAMDILTFRKENDIVVLDVEF